MNKKLKLSLLSALGITVIGATAVAPISVAQNVEERIAYNEAKAISDVSYNVTANSDTQYTFSFRETDVWK